MLSINSRVYLPYGVPGTVTRSAQTTPQNRHQNSPHTPVHPHPITKASKPTLHRSLAYSVHACLPSHHPLRSPPCGNRALSSCHRQPGSPDPEVTSRATPKHGPCLLTPFDTSRVRLLTAMTYPRVPAHPRGDIPRWYPRQCRRSTAGHSKAFADLGRCSLPLA